LFKNVNPDNKIMMINFVKFIQKLILSKDKSILALIIRNKLMKYLLEFYYIYA